MNPSLAIVAAYHMVYGPLVPLFIVPYVWTEMVRLAMKGEEK